jgi:hypothetical protein
VSFRAFPWFKCVFQDERSPEITDQARAKLVYVAGHVVEDPLQRGPCEPAEGGLVLYPEETPGRPAAVGIRRIGMAVGCPAGN